MPLALRPFDSPNSMVSRWGSQALRLADPLCGATDWDADPVPESGITSARLAGFAVDYDEELSVVVVRTKRKTNYEKKLKKKVQTSGCAQGTAFGDLMEALENVTLPPAELRTSWLYTLTHKINTTPSLYLRGRRHPRLRAGRRGSPCWSIWRTSAATTPSTRSPAGCSSIRWSG